MRWLGALGAVSALAVAMHAGHANGSASPPGSPSPIAIENARPGTPGWLGPPATDRAAEVYAPAAAPAPPAGVPPPARAAPPGHPVPRPVPPAPAAPYRIVVYRLGWYGGVGG